MVKEIDSPMGNYQCEQCGMVYFNEDRARNCERDQHQDRNNYFTNSLEFYYGLECSGTDRKLPNPDHIFISAGTLWEEGRERFKRPTFPSHDSLMLDCGGFSFFDKFEYDSYPFTPGELARLANSLRADYVATIDYPCEPELLEAKDWSVEDNIERTVENAEKCMKHEIKGEWMPVIQGYSVEDYKKCVDKYLEKGLLENVKRVAIGSVCVRNRPTKIEEIVNEVADYLAENGIYVEIHLFGLSLRAVKRIDVWRRITSVDSGAWRFCDCGDHFYPRSEEEKIEFFKRYQAKINRVNENFKNQTMPNPDAYSGKEDLEEYRSKLVLTPKNSMEV